MKDKKNRIIDNCVVWILNDQNGSIADVFYLNDGQTIESFFEKEMDKCKGDWFMTLRESINFIKSHPIKKNYMIDTIENDTIKNFLLSNGIPENQIFIQTKP